MQDMTLNQAEVRIKNCVDGYLMEDPRYRKWVGIIRQFILCKLGPSPKSKIFGYGQEGRTLLAFDLEAKDSAPNEQRFLSITVLLSGNEARLEYPGDNIGNDQLDIALPGMADALNFVALVLLPDEPIDWTENALWVFPVGAPTA